MPHGSVEQRTPAAPRYRHLAGFARCLHPTARFAVLVPVKPPAFAKSRLRDLGDDARRDLATAFAVDTVPPRPPARSSTGSSWSPTTTAGRGLADLGVDVIPDGTSDDLNGTLALAAAEMHRRRPDLRLVALCADLPALRPEDLAAALAAAPRT